MFNRTVSRVSQWIQRVEEVLLAGSILLVAALTILNVTCRWLGGFSLAFTEEVSQFCIIVVCFVGISYAASKGRHIRMTAIYDQAPYPLRKLMMVLITASTSFVMFTMSWHAGYYVASVHQLGGIYPVLRVPLYIVYAIAPFGLFLAGIQYALALFKNLVSREIYLSFDHVDIYEDAEVGQM